MQQGSLLQCIKYCNGIYLVNGVATQLASAIEEGKIVTCGGISKSNTNEIGIVLIEDLGIIHPRLNLQILRNIDCFVELQPPMVIDIESLIEQPIEHA